MDVKKPLRSTSDKMKDIYNTYLKNENMEEKNIPIEDSESDISIDDFVSPEGASTEAEIEEKVEQTLREEEEKSLNEESHSQEDMEEEIHTLEDSSESFNKEIISLKDQLIRKTAEMENMRRRTIKEKEDLIKYSNERLLSKFIEISDNIEQALIAASSSDDIDALKKGIELINQNTNKLFNEAGVKKMDDPVGEEFNVEFHEALMQQPSDTIKENHIIQVFQPGYMYKDKVLRHAKVVTSSGN